MNGVAYRSCSTLTQAAATGGYLTPSAGTTLYNLYSVDTEVETLRDTYTATLSSNTTSGTTSVADAMLGSADPSVLDGSTELINNIHGSNKGAPIGQMNVYVSSGTSVFYRVSRSSSTVTHARMPSQGTCKISFVELYG